MKSNQKKRRTKQLSIIMVLMILISLFGINVPPLSVVSAATTGNTYYVDSIGGSDRNDGKSPDTPWYSLKNVNNTVFQPGDHILFKTGSEWNGEQLSPKGSGTNGSPIVIDMYGGPGPKPKFNGAGAVDSTVDFLNQQYWEINNMEITNTAAGAPSDPSKLGDLRGIHVAGKDAGVLKHFYLNNLYVHDVTGWDWWISGSSTTDTPGIKHGTGWDASKRTGGIVFETLQPGQNPVPTKFDDVQIENSVIKDNSFAGIIFKQYENGVNWASRDDGKSHSSPSDPKGQWYDPEWYPHTNITIKNNYFSQYNSDFACDTIYLTSVQGALIENNVSAGAGTSAIEMYYADNVTVQHNEIYDTKAKAGGADSNAIDPDKEATNILIQYNFIHDTGDGILLCGFVFGSATVRYNIIKDAAPSKRFINPHGDKGLQLVYNNILYNTKTGTPVTLVNSSGGSSFLNDSDYFVEFFNNIFYNAATGPAQPVTIASGTGVTYDHNVYYGQNVIAPISDIHAILGDPKFVGPIPTTSGDASSGPLLNFPGFQLHSGSSAIGNGLDEAGMNLSNSAMIFTDNGGKDFSGKVLYNGKPDIGAFEYYGDPNSLTESVTGQVNDSAGKPISGADVSVTLDGTSYTTKSTASGFYSLQNVPLGSGYTVMASKQNYIGDSVNNVDVVKGDTTSGVNLTLVSTNPKGTITGIVKDTSNIQAPPAVSGATVSVSKDNVVYGTTTSDFNGAFTIANLPEESGYSVTISKEGYQPWTVSTVSNLPLTVNAGTTTNIGIVYLSPGKPNYLITDNFDSYATGTVPDGWTTTTTVPGDSVGIAEYPSSTDKSLLLSQPKAGTNGQKTSFYKGLNNLSGIITVEYSVRKSNTNQYFTLPAIYGNNSSNIAISVAMDNTGIIYKDNGATGTSHVIQSYSANTWYDFKIVLNTISKKFDLYINNVKKLNQGSFRYANSTTDYLTGIDFNSNYNVNGSAYINNFRLSIGIAYPADDVKLSSLTTNAGNLTQLDETHYYLNVPNYKKEISLTPQAESTFVSSIQVDGKSAESGKFSPNIPLVDGENEIPVVVTAEDGKTTGTYTVTVNRTPAEIDATLQNLSVSDGTLSPVFSTDTDSYNVSVPYSVSHISVIPTASVEDAVILLNNIPTANGQASQEIPLNEGENNLKLNVTSADGTNNQDYTLIVTREPKPDTTPPVTTDDAPLSWVNQDVPVHLSATDNSEVAHTYYRVNDGKFIEGTMINLVQDGVYTIEYYSIDKLRNVEDVKTVKVKIDKTAPSISIPKLADYIYLDEQTKVVNYSISDNLSGVNELSTVATLDEQPVENGTLLELYKLPLGHHVLTVSSKDRVGNVAEVSVTFTTTTSIPSMEGLIQIFKTNGWIDNQGIATSLLQKLEDKDLQSLIKEVKAQKDKHISNEAAGFLVRDAQYLLN